MHTGKFGRNDYHMIIKVFMNFQCSQNFPIRFCFEVDSVDGVLINQVSLLIPRKIIEEKITENEYVIFRE